MKVDPSSTKEHTPGLEVRKDILENAKTLVLNQQTEEDNVELRVIIEKLD